MGAPDWFVAMMIAYLAAISFWVSAIVRVRNSGGGLGLLMAGWAMWACGVILMLAGTLA